MINSCASFKHLNKIGLLNSDKFKQLIQTCISSRAYAAAAPKKPRIRTAVAASPSIVDKNMRLVDYLSRKDLELQKNVVIDHVTKTEMKFYDPPYLAREAPFPAYTELNINLKGYDFTVLERYHNYIAKMCHVMEVPVKEVYAMPHRSQKVKTYQPFSTKLDKEYALNIYHRVVRVKDLRSTTAPLLFETIQLNLPEGVQLSVTVPTIEEDNFRYVPDLEMQELKKSLEEFEKNESVEVAAINQAATTTAAVTPNSKSPAQPKKLPEKK